jgi:hypothetical protein
MVSVNMRNKLKRNKKTALPKAKIKSIEDTTVVKQISSSYANIRM